MLRLSMARRTIKIETVPELIKEFNIAKAELEAKNSEETLALLLLRCSENGELERVAEESLENRIQK